MPRLPSRNQRSELARAREQRRRELLARADQVRAEVAQLARDCAAASFGPGEEPRPERIDAQLARLEAARAALQLARQLVERDDPEQIADLPEQLQAALGRWKRSSEGWWEARIVERPRLVISRDKDSGQVWIDVVLWPFGPYYYRHWRQEGKQHTQYFGRQRPEGFPDDQDAPEAGKPRLLAPAGRLSREALTLADRLALLHNAEADEKRRRRLRRLLKAAGRRVERRLRAEPREDTVLGVFDEPARTTLLSFPQPPPIAPASKAPRPPGVGFEIAKGPTVYGADHDVIERISDRVNFLGDRGQLGLEAGQAVYDELVDGFVELRQALGRRAAFAEALRRRRDGEPADDPADDRLIEIVGKVIFHPTHADLVDRAADAYGELLSRGRARGGELFPWIDLCIETRGELRRISAEVEELAGQALAQGVPLAAWVAAADRLTEPPPF